MKHLWRPAVLLILFFCCVAGAYGATPPSKHVVLVVEENHSFDSVITKEGMPYLASLAEKYTLLTNYYSNHHPSIGNYFTMTTGQAISANDGYGGVVREENIISQIVAANKRWKCYGESLPNAGYIGGGRGAYAKKHFPAAYFENVRDDEVQRMNLVPIEQLAIDLKSPEGLPDFSMIVPNLEHDAHDGSLREADDWLRQYVSPVLENPEFQKDGILIITFDESFKSDKSNGGGHVTTVVIGPQVKEHFSDETLYQHQSILATVEEALGLGRLKPVENAPDFSNAFK